MPSGMLLSGGRLKTCLGFAENKLKRQICIFVFMTFLYFFLLGIN